MYLRNIPDPFFITFLLLHIQDILYNHVPFSNIKNWTTCRTRQLVTLLIKAFKREANSEIETSLITQTNRANSLHFVIKSATLIFRYPKIKGIY